MGHCTENLLVARLTRMNTSVRLRNHSIVFSEKFYDHLDDSTQKRLERFSFNAPERITMIFNDENTAIVAKLDQTINPRNVTQFYRASAEFVRERGGDFFRGLLSVLDLSGGRYVSIDSRVSMLMPNWYPCIPGWHCDDFYRPEGQPALERLLPIKHYCLVLGADVSSTEFLWQPADLPSPTEIYEACDSDRPLYSYYNEMIEAREFKTRRLRSGEVLQFSGLDFHRGLPAEHAGWRAFIRVSVSDHREPKDEIRTQSQVYLTAPFEGW